MEQAHGGLSIDILDVYDFARKAEDLEILKQEMRDLGVMRDWRLEYSREAAVAIALRARDIFCQSMRDIWIEDSLWDDPVYEARKALRQALDEFKQDPNKYSHRYNLPHRYNLGRANAEAQASAKTEPPSYAQYLVKVGRPG